MNQFEFYFPMWGKLLRKLPARLLINATVSFGLLERTTGGGGQFGITSQHIGLAVSSDLKREWHSFRSLLR